MKITNVLIMVCGSVLLIACGSGQKKNGRDIQLVVDEVSVFEQADTINTLGVHKGIGKPIVSTEWFDLYLLKSASTIHIFPTKKAIEQGNRTEMLEFFVIPEKMDSSTAVFKGTYYAHIVNGKCISFMRDEDKNVRLTKKATFHRNNVNKTFIKEATKALDIVESLVEVNADIITRLKGDVTDGSVTLSRNQIDDINYLMKKMPHEYGLKPKVEHYAAIVGDNFDIIIMHRLTVSQLKKMFSDFAKEYEWDQKMIARVAHNWQEFSDKHQLDDTSTVYSKVEKRQIGWHGNDVYHSIFYFKSSELKKPLNDRTGPSLSYLAKSAGF